MNSKVKIENNEITLTTSEFINSINITCGLYKPLNGFCKFKNYKSIIRKKKNKF